MKDGIKYLRARGIAELTGVSIRTVRRWIADEIISSIKVGGTKLVPKAELQRVLSPPSAAIDQAIEEGHE